MKKHSWILFVFCLAIFIALRLLAGKNEPQEPSEKIKPVVPEPVAVEQALPSHPWLLMQPKVSQMNVEIMRDLAALDELCEAVAKQGREFTHEQIETALIKTLTSLQKHIPFDLPEELYSVFCISETPLGWIQPPIPFHVYKRLYLGEMETGLPFYLDVRVFELEGSSSEELIAWHLETLDGEPSLLFQSKNRVAYIFSGERTRETAHGFAQGVRGLFMDCIEKDGRLYVLYAEAPMKTFQKHESLFNQLAKKGVE